MCRGENSSLIRKNREKLPPIPMVYDDAFIEQLKSFLPHLKETRFSGSGEAFTIDMNYKIWDLLLADNPKCLIMVQTNGTILNGRVKDLLNKGNFEIGVSLDSLQKVPYETIRVNARFEQVMDNVAYFAKYNRERKKNFTISMCVMRQNWHEMADFVHFCNEHHAIINFHKVWAPREFALFNLPAVELQAIHIALAAHELPEDTPLQKRNKQHYHYYLSVIQQWHAEAPALQAQTVLIESLNETELQTLLKQRIAQYIKQMQTDEAEADVMLCLQKFEAVLQRCNPALTAHTLLHWMAERTDEELVGGLKYESVDFIWHEAQRMLGIQT
jgi:hypothetical protein